MNQPRRFTFSLSRMLLAVAAVAVVLAVGRWRDAARVLGSFERLQEVTDIPMHSNTPTYERAKVVLKSKLGEVEFEPA